ncbi:efflux RND transporter permease subunit [Candidatus Venteria ishoeyi]|uniref:Cation efflux system protein CusA n=1 Tax=Candidatus Venteria ishoeyi TaxID=1899563 RepID=A0A1H6FEI4_9GAMM|nr:efflux RND transporter permease subunit [Candidatus Venteria ishoeyi]SEH08457.1 Cation efflux system protein CusA [Candidatus Venteria ishoeyi]
MTDKPSHHESRRPALSHPPIPPVQKVPLGMAGAVADFFIDSPLSPLLLLTTLFIGMIGLLFTPRQEDPEISVPMIDILLQYPGASAEQVNSLAVEPLERLMSEIPGVKHVYSASQREQGMVTVRFVVGEALRPSIVKVHDKLQSNLDKMPPGVSMPLVKPKGIDDVPVVTLTLWSQQIQDMALRTLAHNLLHRLKEVPNTGAGFVVGGHQRQVRIEVLPARLTGFGIGLDQIAQTIRSANNEQGAGSLESGNQVFKVTTGTFLRNAQAVKNLVIGTHRGVPVYVRDVAKVMDGPAETTQMVSFFTGQSHQLADGLEIADGAAAVTIAIAKKEGSNGVRVARDLLDKVESLKGRLIPANVQVHVTRDYGKTANDKVNELLAALLGAAFAVSLLCWITIGGRPALVVIIVIPVVILITIWCTWVLGYTINRVSLFALIFAIGILVDDATVVVENIFRRWLQEGKTDRATAVDAVREVGNPTIIATLTVLAALLPMGFVSGMMGPYMLPIPLLGSVAMVFSLLAAFVFTPWFSMRLRPKLQALYHAEQHEQKIQKKIGKFYRPLIVPLVRRPLHGWIFLILIVLSFFLACVMFYTQAVTVKMLPFDNKPEFNVLINMPEGTALSVTANLTHKLARKLREIPEVTALQTYVGTASPFNFNGMVRHYYQRGEAWHADIQVMLQDKDERARSSHKIAAVARAQLQDLIADTQARIAVVEMPPGPPVLQTMVAEIYGPDDKTRRQVAQDMVGIFEQVPNLVDVDDYMQAPHDIWHFEVDIEKAVRRGISVETINRNIAMAMGGYQLGDIKRGVTQEPVYLVIQVPLGLRGQLSRIGSLPIPATNGETVPLSELGRFMPRPEDAVIYHKDLRPVEYVIGEMEGRLGAPIYGMLAVEEKLKTYQTPDEIQGISGTLTGPPPDNNQSAFEWSGEWVVTYETFRDMGLAFAAALVLIYALLVLEFRNFIQPAIIMAPIPLTLIGIIPGHWLLDAEFTATSMIGFIALAGIEVRNSILLVDFAKNEIYRGTPVKKAVIKAGQIRMRPIWVTDLTMMAGAFAILFDPIFQGMAISLLFGPIVATSLTLLVVPLGCITARDSFCPEAEDNEK